MTINIEVPESASTEAVIAAVNHVAEYIDLVRSGEEEYGNLNINVIVDPYEKRFTILDEDPNSQEPEDVISWYEPWARWASERELPYWVNVYRVDRAYGGPEEGGWWFDTGEPIHTLEFRSKREAQDVAEALGTVYHATGSSQSMAAQEPDYRITLERQKGTAYPTHRPHYE